MMLPSAIRFFVFRDACQRCSKEILGFLKTCPHCGREYPTARRAFYWTYIVLIVLGIPSVALFVLWSILGLRI